jgi:hypothetical protein
VSATDLFERLADAFEAAGVPWALIGGHAVNVWLPPRATGDIDVTVVADGDGMARTRDALERIGYRAGFVANEQAASGPDFIRFSGPMGEMSVEIQAAKTGFQRDVVERARCTPRAPRVPVATAEDLLVFKLIADRSKDQADLRGLVALAGLDWTYIRARAAEWDLNDRLERLLGSVG